MDQNHEHKLHDPLWDCGSSLYDSAMITSHTMSMPLFGPPLPQKKPSKISRSFQKLLKSVFKSKPTTFRIDQGDYFLVYDKSAALTTIPEAPEVDFVGGFSPEINSLARRTASERFPATTTIGISCA